MSLWVEFEFGLWDKMWWHWGTCWKTHWDKIWHMMRINWEVDVNKLRRKKCFPLVVPCLWGWWWGISSLVFPIYSWVLFGYIDHFQYWSSLSYYSFFIFTQVPYVHPMFFFFFFPPNFVTLLKWWSSISIFSKKWQSSKYESRHS
jgi:hypothetical protein